MTKADVGPITAPTNVVIGRDGRVKKKFLVRQGMFINGKPALVGDPNGPACPRCQYQMTASEKNWFCPACAFHSEDNPNFRFTKKK
jgi:hypothetical protein